MFGIFFQFFGRFCPFLSIFGHFCPFLAIFGKFWLKVEMTCLLFKKSNFRLQSGKYKKSYSSSRRTLAQARKRVMEKNEKKRPETMLMTPIKQLKPNSFTHFITIILPILNPSITVSRKWVK